MADEKTTQKIKICFVASSGGHLQELKQIIPYLSNYSHFLITEVAGTGKLESSPGLKTYTVNQINRRERLFVLHFARLFLDSLRIVLKEKPNVVVTTGALIAVPIAFLVKILGGKIIYIESFARIDDPSLTGRIIYKFSDLFIIQWKQLKKYFPKAKYLGSIF